MNYCEGVHPDPPPAELVLDGVVEQHAEEGEHHVGYLLLLGVLGVDVGEGDEPFLWCKNRVTMLIRFFVTIKYCDLLVFVTVLPIPISTVTVTMLIGFRDYRVARESDKACICLF